MLAGFFALLSNILFFTGYISNKNSFEKPLDKEKEKELLEKVKENDSAAKDELAKHNLRLVVHIVKKYASYGDNDELVSVGNVGLAKAINSYSEDKKTQFATFAAKCIENEILMYIRANKKYKETKSLYEPIGYDKDGNDITLIDLISDEEENAFKDFEKKLINETFEKMFKACLSDREKEILNLRYGLFGNTVHTQEEIAKKYKISRSYVSRIETKALNKLRTYIKANDITI